MHRRGRSAVLLGWMFVVIAGALPVAAEEKIEGSVVSTMLTSCEFKPGTCEGSLVLDTKGGRKDGHVTIKVPKGTQIKKGNDHLFLPGLKGNIVAITYVEDRGEKTAKSIEVKTSNP